MSLTLKSLRNLFSSRSVFLGATTATIAVLGACNPYERRSGEYSAGSVDPIKFPSAYLGTDGDPKNPGGGTFQYVVAWVGGKPVIYYPLPFNGMQAASSQLDLLKLQTATRPIPLAYVFDPKQGDASADSDKCQKPEGYEFDRQRDAVRYDRQGNLFTSLPTESDPAGNTRYVPIVREVTVASSGNRCQDIKSEATLVTRTDVQVALDKPPEGNPTAMPTGHPSGRYLAFAIIDPAASVKPPEADACPQEIAAKCSFDPVTGLGPQRWGWFQQYLLAYLDGGYIPLKVVQPMGKMLMQEQNLYYPETIRDRMAGKDVEGSLGMGLDVMDRRRGEDGYSPICHVYSFVPKDTMNPEKSVNDIDMSQVTDTKQYVYCLQTP